MHKPLMLPCRTFIYMHMHMSLNAYTCTVTHSIHTYSRSNNLAQVYMYYRTHGTLYPCFLLYFLYSFCSYPFFCYLFSNLLFINSLLTPFLYCTLSPFNSFTTLLDKAFHFFTHVTCTRQIFVTNFLSIMHLVLSLCNLMLMARILLPPFSLLLKLCFGIISSSCLCPLFFGSHLVKKRWCVADARLV